MFNKIIKIEKKKVLQKKTVERPVVKEREKNCVQRERNLFEKNLKNIFFPGKFESGQVEYVTSPTTLTQPDPCLWTRPSRTYPL